MITSLFIKKIYPVKMTTTLIFDIEINGHHLEYLSHIIECIIREQEERKFVFIVSHDFKNRYVELIGDFPDNNNVIICEASSQEISYLLKGNVINQSIKNYKFLISKANEYKASKIICLHFNIFIFALIFYRNRFEISGILFHQFSRMEKKRLIQKIKYYRKYIQTWFLTFNKQIKEIFILNDRSTVISLNSSFKTNIFKMLPDPIPEWKALENYNIRTEYDIDIDKKIFIHTGALEERKGIFELLDAIELLERNDYGKFVLFILGKASFTDDRMINNKIDSLKHKYQDLEIIYKNEFISNALLKAFFIQCDCVLIPYKNVESSSGIVGHAIISGKTIIGPIEGLIGEIIHDYGNSVLLKEVTPESISKAIKQIINSESINKIWEDYTNTHTPKLFATTLIKCQD